MRKQSQCTLIWVHFPKDKDLMHYVQTLQGNCSLQTIKRANALFTESVVMQQNSVQVVICWREIQG